MLEETNHKLGENIYKRHATGKGLLSRIYRELNYVHAKTYTVLAAGPGAVA